MNIISAGVMIGLLTLLAGELCLASMLMDRVDKLTKRVKVIEYALQKKVGRQDSGKSSDEGVQQFQGRKEVKENSLEKYDT